MTHPEDLLADLVAGSLREVDRTILDAHLATCARCSAEVRAAMGARSALRSLVDVPVPTSVASKAQAIPNVATGHPGWYRWLGAAAAAAVIALVLVSIPRGSGPNPHNPEDVNIAAPAQAGGAAASKSSSLSLQLLVQPTDFDQASLDELTKATLETAVTPAPTAAASAAEISGARIGTDAELQTALTCVAKAVPSKTGAPFKLILARFDGKAAFLAFYYRGARDGQPATGLVVWIVDGQTCTPTGLSSTAA